MTVNANRGQADRNPVVRTALAAARIYVTENLSTLNHYGAVDVAALDKLRAVLSLIDAAMISDAGQRTRDETRTDNRECDHAAGVCAQASGNICTEDYARDGEEMIS